MIFGKLILAGLIGWGGWSLEIRLWHTLLKVGKPVRGVAAGINSGLDMFIVMLTLGIVAIATPALIFSILALPSRGKLK